MDQAIKAKWIAALRSGQYEQGQSFLRNGDKYCCLGVLCDIIDSSKWDRVSFTWLYRYLGNETTLPSDIKQTADVSSNVSRLLMCMNDGGKTFDEIADYIEREL